MFLGGLWNPLVFRGTFAVCEESMGSGGRPRFLGLPEWHSSDTALVDPNQREGVSSLASIEMLLIRDVRHHTPPLLLGLLLLPWSL